LDIETLQIPTMIVDKNAYISKCNGSLVRFLFCKDSSEIVGKNILEFILKNQNHLDIIRFLSNMSRPQIGVFYLHDSQDNKMDCIFYAYPEEFNKIIIHVLDAKKTLKKYERYQGDNVFISEESKFLINSVLQTILGFISNLSNSYSANRTDRDIFKDLEVIEANVHILNDSIQEILGQDILSSNDKKRWGKINTEHFNEEFLQFFDEIISMKSCIIRHGDNCEISTFYINRKVFSKIIFTIFTELSKLCHDNSVISIDTSFSTDNSRFCVKISSYINKVSANTVNSCVKYASSIDGTVTFRKSQKEIIVIEIQIPFSENKKSGIEDLDLVKKIKKKEDIKILIVDDFTEHRNLFSFMLGRLGFKKIYEESDGKDAVDLLEHNQSIDFVFMDINMRNMNGDKACKMIKEELGLDVTVVGLTASNVENLSKLDIDPSYFDDILSKPISEEQMLSIISKYIELEN
jgi:two-component system cell cycle response regulator DivK